MRSRGESRAVIQPAAALEAAFDDARTLALEISCGIPSGSVDVMTLGLVLDAGETAYRCAGVWLAVQDAGAWTHPMWITVVVTDQRLLVRCEDGRLLSLSWAHVTGLQPVLGRQQIFLNYGDEPPIAFLGAETAALAVAAVASVFGVASLVTHPALSLLRHQ